MKRSISFGFDIVKFDAEQRLVMGCATDSITDRQGDSIPFKVAVAAFEEGADTLGIREMHQPRAVGRLVKWMPDEERSAVDVAVYLSESTDGEDALTKVKEGILRGFSIGGNALKSHREGGVNVIDCLEIVEISLVDVPANPDATISVVKVEGADVKKGLDGSYYELGSRIQEAVSDRCRLARELAGTSPSECACAPDCWVDDYNVSEVVYRDGSALYRCGWGRDSQGSIFLGQPEEVEETYVPKGTPDTASEVSLTTEVPSMASELVIKNREQMAVAKALTARNLVEKGDVGSAINSVSELLSTAGSDPDALAQAQAALAVVGEMVTSMGSSSSSGSSSSTDSSSTDSSSTPSSSSSTDSSTSSPESFSASSPSTLEKEAACKEASSTTTPSSTSTTTSTDSSTSPVTKDMAPAGPGAPAGVVNAPNPGNANVMGVTLEQAAKAGAAAAVAEMLAAAPVSLWVGTADFWAEAQAPQPDPTKPKLRKIILSTMTGDTSRALPYFATCTDLDQRRISATDAFCERVPRYYTGYQVTWPRF